MHNTEIVEVSHERKATWSQKSDKKFQESLQKEGIHIGNWILRWIQEKKELEMLQFWIISWVM